MRVMLQICCAMNEQEGAFPSYFGVKIKKGVAKTPFVVYFLGKNVRKAFSLRCFFVLLDKIQKKGLTL